MIAAQARESLRNEAPFFGKNDRNRVTINWSALWRRPQAKITALVQQTNAFGLLGFGDPSGQPPLKARRLRQERAIASAKRDEESGEAMQSTLEDMALNDLGLPLHGSKTSRPTVGDQETFDSKENVRRGEPSGALREQQDMARQGLQLRAEGVAAWQGVYPRSMAIDYRDRRLPFDEDNSDPTLHRSWTGNFAISPRKLRELADVVRGLPIEMAILQMKFSPRAASHKVVEMLEGARDEALARGFNREQLAVGAPISPLSRGPTS